jgi:hypothetical protein
MDSGICQTSTASPAQPGGLPLVLGETVVGGVMFRPTCGARGLIPQSGLSFE